VTLASLVQQQQAKLANVAVMDDCRVKSDKAIAA
jgi:hypothetical protein